MIFRNRGQTQRLQGWNRTGSACSYDTDLAIVDTLIALAIENQWAWAMRANGMLLLWKARALNSDKWAQQSAKRLRTAANLAERSNNKEVLNQCRELLSLIESGTWNEASALATIDPTSLAKNEPASPSFRARSAASNVELASRLQCGLSVLSVLESAEERAFGPDDVGWSLPCESSPSIAPTRWLTQTEHKWIILGEPRGMRYEGKHTI